MKKIESTAGYTSLCIAIFQQAQKDYTMYRETMENKEKSLRKRFEAKKNFDRLKEDFESGNMDLYTLTMKNIDGMDIYQNIEKKYEAEKHKKIEPSVINLTNFAS